MQPVIQDYSLDFQTGVVYDKERLLCSPTINYSENAQLLKLVIW